MTAPKSLTATRPGVYTIEKIRELDRFAQELWELLHQPDFGAAEQFCLEFIDKNIGWKGNCYFWASDQNNPKSVLNEQRETVVVYFPCSDSNVINGRARESLCNVMRYIPQVAFNGDTAVQREHLRKRTIEFCADYLELRGVQLHAREQNHGQWTPALGLRFDDKRRIVERKDVAGHVDLSTSELFWAILRKLAANDGVPISHDAVRAVWEKHGRAKKPADGTVHDAITVLRKAILPLGLDIKTKRGLGRQLVETSTRKPSRSSTRKSDQPRKARRPKK